MKVTEQKKTKAYVFKNAIKVMFFNFFEHNIGKNAAALAYYLLFSIFPLLIFLFNLLGLLDLNVYAITKALEQFLPSEIVGIVEAYLDYISHTSSHILMWFALIFSIWFPLRAVQGLMDDVRRAYGLKRPKRFILYSARQLVYTIIFLMVIVLTLFLSIMGEEVISYIYELLPDDAWKTSDYLLGVWQYLRFLPIAFLMIAAIGTLYAASLDKIPPIKTILPGIFWALPSWLILSIGFSFYVENFSHYSIIYGALGAIIVLLIWLYMTAIILILGAELNAALIKCKNG